MLARYSYKILKGTAAIRATCSAIWMGLIAIWLEKIDNYSEIHQILRKLLDEIGRNKLATVPAWTLTSDAMDLHQRFGTDSLPAQ